MKITFSRLFDNNQFVRLLSILVAVLIWFGVVSGVDARTSRTIRNIPIQINVMGSVADQLGLKALLENDLMAEVVITGDRNVVGNVAPEDISVKPVLDGIVGPGVYELRLVASDVHSMGFEILSIRTPTVQVRFDRMTTKKLSLKVDMGGITVPEGYVMGEEYVSPTEVTVTGPETEMAQVASGLVKVKIEKPLEQSANLSIPIQILNADGNEVKSPFFTMDNANATVTIPVLKKKTVPVTVGFINAPSEWNENIVPYSISPSQIEIAGPANSIDTITELHLGYIDTQTLGESDIYTMPVILPTGFISVENVQNATVTFHGDNITRKIYNISNISVINLPANYDATVSTKTIYNVSLLGPQSALESISASDLVAEIDFMNQQVRVGQTTMPVNIVIKGNNDVWVNGTYKAVVIVKEKK